LNGTLGNARQNVGEPCLRIDVVHLSCDYHPNSDIDKLLPWAYCRQDLKAGLRTTLTLDLA
jgi:hypothetical protein